MNRELDREYNKARYEEFKRLQNQLKGIKSEIESYNHLIKNLELKAKLKEMEMAQYKDEWVLRTQIDVIDKWQGKRRPTGCK